MHELAATSQHQRRASKRSNAEWYMSSYMPSYTPMLGAACAHQPSITPLGQKLDSRVIMEPGPKFFIHYYTLNRKLSLELRYKSGIEIHIKLFHKFLKF